MTEHKVELRDEHPANHLSVRCTCGWYRQVSFAGPVAAAHPAQVWEKARRLGLAHEQGENV